MTAEEVLLRRARALARPTGTAAEAVPTTTVLRFRSVDQGYAVPLADVRQVVSLAGAARLPAEAAPLVGIAAVAGEVVPVAGLARDPAAGSPAWGVAVASAGLVLCLPADEIDGVAEVADTAVTPVDPGAAADGRTAITTDGDVLLDVAAIVSSIRRRRATAVEDRPDADGREP